MERFASGGWNTISLADLVAVAVGQRTSGPREFVIMFDDAYRGLRDHAFPVLRRIGFSAICSVITDYAGRLNRWDVAYGGRRFAHLAWRDMRRWQGHGVEFISHTARHPRLTWLSPDAVRRELAESRGALAAALGEQPAAISFPFGAAADRECALARREGYTAGFALAGRWSGDVMRITRLPIYSWSPPMPGSGVLRSLERVAASGANRCAVGTTLWRTVRSHTQNPLRAAEDSAYCAARQTK